MKNLPLHRGQAVSPRCLMQLALAKVLPIFEPSAQVWGMVEFIISISQLRTEMGAHAKEQYRLPCLIMRKI
jgi:hypothetical protein